MESSLKYRYSLFIRDIDRVASDSCLGGVVRHVEVVLFLPACVSLTCTMPDNTRDGIFYSTSLMFVVILSWLRLEGVSNIDDFDCQETRQTDFSLRVQGAVVAR